MLTAFLGLNMEQEGAKIVSSAILGMDFKVVVVAGKSYVIAPPTIKRLAGAGYWLSSIYICTHQNCVFPSALFPFQKNAAV